MMSVEGLEMTFYGCIPFLMSNRVSMTNKMLRFHFKH